MLRTYLLLGVLAALGACSTASTAPDYSVSVGLYATYDAGVSAETVYLAAKTATPAEAQKLQTLRKTAYADLQAVIAAETAGGDQAALTTVATTAINAFLTEAQGAK